jgi:hypothetical protein
VPVPIRKVKRGGEVRRAKKGRRKKGDFAHIRRSAFSTKNYNIRTAESVAGGRNEGDAEKSKLRWKSSWDDSENFGSIRNGDE